MPDMVRTISVRLDEGAQRALSELEATGMTPSEAVRAGLEAAAQRLRDRRHVSEEAAALAQDETDRAEMAAISEMMEQLRAPW